MDGRQAYFTDKWFGILKWCLGAVMLWILALVGIAKMEPDKQIVTKTVTQQVQIAVPEPINVSDVPIGAMTTVEFNYITPGMKSSGVTHMFGTPPGNVAGDYKTFYPAAGGGKYWIYYKEAKHSYDIIVKSKKYVR